MTKDELILNQLMQSLHLDDSQSLFFAGELAHAKTKAYDIEYPELKARGFVPVDSTTPEGAATVKYRQNNSLGSGKVISDHAEDLPRVENTSEEFSHPIRRLGASFGYSKDEIQYASRVGINLDDLKAATARNIIEKLIDDKIATGDTVVGWKGFTNHSDVAASNVANGSWLTTATGDEMIADLNNMVAAVLNATNNLEAPNTIIMPEAHRTKLAHTRMPDINMTVLQFFLANSPYITSVEGWHKLDTAGASSKPRAICYNRSADKLWAEIPVEFSIEPPQLRNFETVFNCTAKFGGVIIPKPKSLVYADNLGDA